MPHDGLNQQPPLPRSNRTPFEWSLSALQPSAEPANSPAILFEAGRSSRDGEVRLLKIVCGSATMLALSLCALGVSAVLLRDEPVVVPTPTTRLIGRDVETSPSTEPGSYGNSPSNQPDQRIQLTQTVRPWRAIEQPKIHEPSTSDARELAEQLQFRRSLLNTGLGLLPTEGPDLTPTETSCAEK
jgi:hypothetical protein